MALSLIPSPEAIAELALDPFASEFWLRIGVAFLCAGMIGTERQLRGKPAGIRTSSLICLGTLAFVQLGVSLGGVSGSDPTRVLGQVVTGIGFLGAGVILTREGLVSGVTTASVVWVLAAIGASIGLGLLDTAVALALVVVTTLYGVEFLERRIRALRRGAHAKTDDPEHL